MARRHAPCRSGSATAGNATPVCTPEAAAQEARALRSDALEASQAVLLVREVVAETSGRVSLRARHAPTKTRNHALFKEYVNELVSDYAKRESARAACVKVELEISQLREWREGAARRNDLDAVSSLDARLEHEYSALKECTRQRMRIEGAMAYNLVSINKLAHLKYS